jgi:hypothetical protein
MQLVRYVAYGFALLTAIFSVNASAEAQGRPPIGITDCTLLQYAPEAQHPFWRPFGPYPIESYYADGIRIVYVNHGPLAATRVAFVVNYRGDVQRIIDVGTFSVNVTINHTFGNFTGDAWLGPRPNSCRAVAVRFADNSAWRAAAPLRRRTVH